MKNKKYMIALRPGRAPELVECPDGLLRREDVRGMVGEEYTVVPTFIADLVMILHGDNTDENEKATDMLRVTDNQTVLGNALLAAVTQNRIAGMTAERAEYWMRNLNE